MDRRWKITGTNDVGDTFTAIVIAASESHALGIVNKSTIVGSISSVRECKHGARHGSETIKIAWKPRLPADRGGS